MTTINKFARQPQHQMRCKKSTMSIIIILILNDPSHPIKSVSESWEQGSRVFENAPDFHGMAVGEKPHPLTTAAQTLIATAMRICTPKGSKRERERSKNQINDFN